MKKAPAPERDRDRPDQAKPAGQGDRDAQQIGRVSSETGEGSPARG